MGLDFSDFCNCLLHFPQRYTSRRPGERTLVFLVKPARATPSLGRRGLRHRETRPAARWQVRRGRAALFRNTSRVLTAPFTTEICPHGPFCFFLFLESTGHRGKPPHQPRQRFGVGCVLSERFAEAPPRRLGDLTSDRLWRGLARARGRTRPLTCAQPEEAADRGT